jgi:type II secretory ATPase GspE/PulE/Tfp pilus assembly ATPase PilB-like protein
MIPDGRLADILINSDTIEPTKLREIQDKVRLNKVSLHDYLVRGKVLSEEDIVGAVIEVSGLSYLRLESVNIQKEACALVTEEFCRKHTLIPISLVDNVLTVAVEDILLPDVHSQLRRMTGKDVVLAVAEGDTIIKAIEERFKGEESEAAVDKLMGDVSMEDMLAAEAAAEEEEDEGEESSENDSLIVKLVNSIIIDAYMKGASDIHIESYRGSGRPTRIRIRVDGSLLDYRTIPNRYVRAVVSRIKIMSKLDIAERRVPQDGKILFHLAKGRSIELRVATMPVAGEQEDVVMRILAGTEPMRLAKLGLEGRNYQRLRAIVEQPYGMILVVGPTGSGKTTTLHSVMAHLNTAERKIWTAEDPVEITQYGLRQVQIAPKRGLTFARALRSFLRADPDVIMVGEMRDMETASIGVEASLTGHLLLSTLHTNNAPETVVRLLEMGLDPFSFADALLGVLAQRLVRTLCPDCKETYHPTREEYDNLIYEFGQEEFLRTTGSPVDREYSDSLELSRRNENGCNSCSWTGYRGRIAIHELLASSDELKHLVVTGSPVAAIREQAVKEGMTTLKQDGIVKVLKGVTDIHEVRRVCSR